jgi:hypothetical protein
MMRKFAQSACIDWSGAVSERPPGLAVAIIEVGRAPELVNPDRRWSRHDILQWLIKLANDETDILIGLDLSFGFPFLDQNSYFPQWQDSPPTARKLWRLVDEMCQDDCHYGISSFLKHDQAKRHFRHSQGDVGDLFAGGIGRLRAVEHHQRKTGQGNSWSCFNLVGAGQVGKSSLTGMRILNQLNGRIPIWPFDPVPDRGPMIAEIYTSIAARAAGLPKGRSKTRDRAGLEAALGMLAAPLPKKLPRYDDHATDAVITAAWLQNAAAIPALWQPKMLKSKIIETEGWTFGVI